MAKFINFFKTIIPVVRAEDEDIVNPQEQLQAQCLAKNPMIAALHEKLETCTARVNSRTKTEETCAEELFDYLDALNDCVAQDLTSKLK